MAHRDLTKVWHPDRFGSDEVMREKAEEKLKQINEAFETIRAGGPRWRPAGGAPQPRDALRRLMIWVFALVFGAFFILLRRPTLGGLLIAGALFIGAFVLIVRMKKIEGG